MTQPRRRHFRIVWEDRTERPWIVQYEHRGDHTWADVHRFATCEQATSYMIEVKLRDALLLEAER